MNNQAAAEAIIDAVRLTGQLIAYKKQIPQGELYAQLMGHISLENFNRLVDLLVRTKMVKKQGYLLVWVGPDLPTT